MDAADKGLGVDVMNDIARFKQAFRTGNADRIRAAIVEANDDWQHLKGRQIEPFELQFTRRDIRDTDIAYAIATGTYDYRIPH